MDTIFFILEYHLPLLLTCWVITLLLIHHRTTVPTNCTLDELEAYKLKHNMLLRPARLMILVSAATSKKNEDTYLHALAWISLILLGLAIAPEFINPFET